MLLKKKESLLFYAALFIAKQTVDTLKTYGLGTANDPDAR